MIDISNGLLPDLKAEELAKKEKTKKRTKIIAEFSYDNSLEETDDAMKTFQKSFSSKRGKLSIIAYSILAVASIAAIVFNPTQVVLYIALAFCAFGLYYSLTEKKRMRRKVIETIKGMSPEDYHCVIFDNRIEIETIIKPKDEEKAVEGLSEKPAVEEAEAVDEEKKEISENSTEENVSEKALNNDNTENVENSEEIENPQNAEEDFQPIKSVFKFGEDMLDFVESDMSLLLILARRQIYCFPKRCLSDEQQTTIRDFLTKKLSSLNF